MCCGWFLEGWVGDFFVCFRLESNLRIETRNGDVGFGEFGARLAAFSLFMVEWVKVCLSR